jgi:hypothetical protein
MEGNERKRECDQHAQGMPETLAAFWGNQLERLKRRVEGQVSRTSASSNSHGKFRLEPGCGNGK